MILLDIIKGFLPSKLWLYATLAVGLIASGLSIAAYIASGARNAEKLKQASATLEHYKKEAAVNEETQRLSASAARQRLRDRWKRK